MKIGPISGIKHDTKKWHFCILDCENKASESVNSQIFTCFFGLQAVRNKSRYIILQYIRK